MIAEIIKPRPFLCRKIPIDNNKILARPTCSLFATTMDTIPKINYATYPLRDIPQPHSHDVLCGRGGGTNNHIGNSHWRMLVAANKKLYITLPKRQKMLLSRSIVNAVRSQNPPGRFLQKDNKSNLWFDVGDQRAQEKTSQALREGAPDIRKEVASAKEGFVVDSTVNCETDEKGDNIKEGDSDSEITPLRVSDTSTTAPTTSEGDVAPLITTASSASPSDPVISSNNNPPHMPASTGHASLTGSAIGNEMHLPQHRFPSSSGGSLNNPSQQHNMPMLTGNNNVALMQMMYQTMMMAEHGGSGMGMNPSMLTPQQQHQLQMMQMIMAAGNSITNSHLSQQISGPESAVTQSASNMGSSLHQQQAQQYPHNLHHQQPSDLEPLPLPENYHRNNNVDDSRRASSSIPTFDEYVQAPENLEPAGLSYGSMSLSENEMRRLQTVGASFGSGVFMRQSDQGVNGRNSIQQQEQQQHHHHQNGQVALPSFQPHGISIGDATMMSAGTNNMMKLENTGTSFGTAMSFNTCKIDMVDGGLMDTVGTSFGSLSLDPKAREALFRTLEITASGPEIPPMFHSEEKAQGNLLDCSDTESENSEDKEKLIAQKSQAWERMKQATETRLKQQQSKGSVASHDLMPPPVGLVGQPLHREPIQPSSATNFVNTEVTIPTTTLENNFSTLSAWSAADDFDGGNDEDIDAFNDTAAPPPPPQPLVKDDEW
jgi:hypothetical protein